MSLRTPDGKPTTLQAGDVLKQYVFDNEFFDGYVQILRNGDPLLFVNIHGTAENRRRLMARVNPGDNGATVDILDVADLMAASAGLAIGPWQVNVHNRVNFVTFKALATPPSGS